MAKNKVRVQTQLHLGKVETGMELAAGSGEGDLRLGLSFTGTIHLKELGKLLDDEHAAALFDHMYDGDAILQTAIFDNIKVGTTVKDCIIQLGNKDDGCILPDSILDKIELVPRPGRTFDIKVRAIVYPKPKQESKIVYEFYKRIIKVIVDGGTRLLDAVDQTEMPLEPGASAE